MKDDSKEHTEGGQTWDKAKPVSPPAAADGLDKASRQDPGQEQETRLTPELREWARQQFTEEEIVAALRELRGKGGLELGDFLQELEQIVRDRERTER
jgi:hypothetical protein